MPSHLLSPLFHLSAPTVYSLVALLVFGEAGFLVGFVLPGETAVIIGGVIAERGGVSLPLLVGISIAAAVLGDSLGYEVGRRFGPRLLEVRVLQERRAALDRARDLVRRRGGWAVFGGRFVAFLRTVVPGIAGISEMRYATFLRANAAGGALWAAGYALAGFAFGSAYGRLEHVSAEASGAVLGVLVVAAVVWRLRARRREHDGERTGEGTSEDADEERARRP